MSQSVGAPQQWEYGQLLANARGNDLRYITVTQHRLPFLSPWKHGTSRERQDFLNG